ncbi:MAG: hypothetical protein K2N56_02290, partial [Oscillospiraceae bacterium]|nr:hypothetical protein [Oscillospiraceae bacterium]
MFSLTACNSASESGGLVPTSPSVSTPGESLISSNDNSGDDLSGSTSLTEPSSSSAAESSSDTSSSEAENSKPEQPASTPQSSSEVHSSSTLQSSSTIQSSSSVQSSGSVQSSSAEQSSSNVQSSSTVQSSSVPQPSIPPQPQPEPEPEPESPKILVAYFSATNTTKGVANHISEALKADLYEIVPADPYTSADLNYNNSSSRSSIEMNDPNSRPAISGSVSGMDKYDIVFIGYPIWWGEA